MTVMDCNWGWGRGHVTNTVVLLRTNIGKDDLFFLVGTCNHFTPAHISQSVSVQSHGCALASTDTHAHY